MHVSCSRHSSSAGAENYVRVHEDCEYVCESGQCKQNIYVLISCKYLCIKNIFNRYTIPSGDSFRCKMAIKVLVKICKLYTHIKLDHIPLLFHTHLYPCWQTEIKEYIWYLFLYVSMCYQTIVSELLLDEGFKTKLL